MDSIADRMAGMVGERRKHEPGEGLREPKPTHGEGEDAGGQTTITHHPDGKHSVEHADGEKTGPHEHIHEAMAHISAKQIPGEAHSHVHHEMDGTHTSHHASKEGEVSGPHNHENLDALKEHMGKFLDEEKNEWSGGDYKG